MDCNIVAADDLAEKYLLGEMNQEEQEAYELHFFECELCYEGLKDLQSLRAALREFPRPSVRAHVAPRRAYWRLPWVWLAPAVLAASVAAVVLLVIVSRPPVQVAQTPAVPAEPPVVRPPVAPSPPETSAALEPALARPSAVAPRRADVIARLARVDPPRYSPRVLRGAVDGASKLFHEGMRSYSRGDYAAAIPLLRRAAGEDPTRADIAFFLGAAELASGDYAAAKADLEHVIAGGGTPFTDEAQFYLAKACLGRGDVEAARGALNVVIATNGEFADEAGRLMAELKQLPSE